MPVIDVHAHIITRGMVESIASTGTTVVPSFVEADGGVYLQRGEKFRFGVIPHAIHDVDLRIREMNQQGVDMQALAVAPMIMGYEQNPEIGKRVAQTINESILDVARSHPTRFAVVGSLPMQDPDAAVEEIVRIAADPMVRAVQIGTHVEELNLDAPKFEAVWAQLVDSDLGVIVHPNATARSERLRRYHLGNLIGNPTDSTVAIASLIFGGVPDRHPHLRFAFLHGGGFAPYQIGRWDHGWVCRAEAKEVISEPPSRYLSRFYFDSLTHDRLSLEFLGRRVGWDHVVLGSDYPFDMSDRDPVAKVRVLGLSGEEESRVLSANGEALLRRSGLDWDET